MAPVIAPTCPNWVDYNLITIGTTAAVALDGRSVALVSNWTNAMSPHIGYMPHIGAGRVRGQARQLPLLHFRKKNTQ